MIHRTRLSLSLREAVRRDFIALNNTVLVEGLLISPILMAATTLKGAAAMIICAVIIILPSVVLDKVISGRIPSIVRWPVCLLTASLFTVPAYYVVQLFFQSNVPSVGVNGTLLMADAVIIAAFNDKRTVSVFDKFRDVSLMLLGFSIVAVLMGVIREILGSGNFIGRSVFERAPMPFVNTTAGGMIILAVFAAVVQFARQTYLASRAPYGKDAAEL